MSLHARAPLRIDFAGGWSDDVTFSSSDVGCVVNATIDSYVHVDVLTVGGKTIRLHSEDLREHVTITSPRQLTYDGRLDRHKAALNMLPLTGGVEILSRTEAPPGSGLGENAALDTALLAALARGRMEDYETFELADLGMMLERDELGFPEARQDFCAAVSGGFRELRFQDDGIVSNEIAIGDEAAVDLAGHLVLAYTGRSHFTAQTHKRVWDEYRSGNQDVTGALRCLRDTAREVRSTLEAGDWRGLARLVDANWQCQKRLDSAIVTPRTRSIEEALQESGAWAIKAMGEGVGGCYLAVCSPERRGAVVDAARTCGAGVIDLFFTQDGVTVTEGDDDPVP